VDSRIESQGQPTARAWALNRIRDRAGNAILFEYTEDAANGSYRLARVRYGGNASQGVAPPYELRFTYEARPAGEIDSRYAPAASSRKSRGSTASRCCTRASRYVATS